MLELPTYTLPAQMVIFIPYIGQGSCKWARVNHWLILVFSTSMLLNGVWLSSALPPATITKVLNVVTPGRNLLVGIGGRSCCQPCSDQVLTRLEIAPDDASRPPRSTSWFLMTAASLLNWGAGGSIVHVFLSRSYTCTRRARITQGQIPPQT